MWFHTKNTCRKVLKCNFNCPVQLIFPTFLIIHIISPKCLSPLPSSHHNFLTWKACALGSVLAWLGLFHSQKVGDGPFTTTQKIKTNKNLHQIWNKRIIFPGLWINGKKGMGVSIFQTKINFQKITKVVKIRLQEIIITLFKSTNNFQTIEIHLESLPDSVRDILLLWKKIFFYLKILVKLKKLHYIYIYPPTF